MILKLVIGTFLFFVIYAESQLDTFTCPSSRTRDENISLFVIRRSFRVLQHT